MTDWKKINDAVNSVEFNAKYALSTIADLQKAGVALRAEIAKATADGASDIDWTRPVAALSYTPCPEWTLGIPTERAVIAALTDEAVAALQATADAWAAEDARVRKINAETDARWMALLKAHGIGAHKRTDVAGLAVEQARAKFKAPNQYGTSVDDRIRSHAERYVPGTSGFYVRTVAELRARAVAAIDQERRERDQERAKASRERDAEAARAETERENARLRAQLLLAKPLPPMHAPKPAQPEEKPKDRIAMLELE